jgi:hypothetical protein
MMLYHSHYSHVLEFVSCLLLELLNNLYRYSNFKISNVVQNSEWCKFCDQLCRFQISKSPGENPGTSPSILSLQKQGIPSCLWLVALFLRTNPLNFVMSDFIGWSPWFYSCKPGHFLEIYLMFPHTKILSKRGGVPKIQLHFWLSVGSNCRL